MSPVRLLSLGGVLLLSLAACNGLQINRGDFLRRAMTTGGSTAAAVLVSQPQSASAAKTLCIPFIDKGAPASFECGPKREYPLPDQQALKVKFDADRAEFDKKARAAGYANAEEQVSSICRFVPPFPLPLPFLLPSISLITEQC